MRLFPARESRWRDWLPEDASSGAVPFQEANRSRLANRWTPATSASSRAAPEGPVPCRFHQGGSAGRDQPGEFLVQGPGLLAGGLEFAGQLDGEPAAGLSGQVARLDGGDQRAGLPGGAELLGPAGQQLQQEPVQPAGDLGACLAELVAAVGEHAHHHQVLPGPGPAPGPERAGQPARLSAHRPGQSCGRCRWRTPAPARIASAARRTRSRRHEPGGAPDAGRCRCSPPPPRPGPRTSGPRPASERTRPCPCHTCPLPVLPPARR
jgi:hypothetical protein